MKLESIPRYLKENANWCLRKKEVRNRKETKILINPRTGAYVSVNKKDNFSRFKKAVEKLKCYEGLGIRVDENLVAIDVDDCVINGKLYDTGLEIVEHFPQSYIEYCSNEKGLEDAKARIE